MHPFRRPAPGVYYQPAPPLGRRIAGWAGRAAGRGVVRSVRAGYRHRNRLWPSIAAAGMLGVSTYLGLWADGWKTAIVLAVIAGAVLGWSQWRAWQVGEAWIVRSLIVSWATWASCVAWTATAAGVGSFTAPMPGILIAATLLAQLWWPIHQQLRKERAAAETSVEERAENLFDERVDTWMTAVACPGGALPGAQLYGISDLPDGRGWEAIIQLPAHDAQSSETAVAAVRRIAKAYRVPVAQVVVETDPDGMEDTARLLVLNHNPLRKIQLVETLTLNQETGEVRIGWHADGEPAMWRLWTPGSGVCHGMVAGTTGSGKSGLLRILCTEIRHSGVAQLMLADPEGGESAPDWVDGAHCFAGGIPRIRRMLQGVERVMKARKRRRARHRWIDDQGRTRRGHGAFTPTKDEPAIYVVIDEAPDVLADPECRRIIDLIGKKGRKWGIAAIIFVQVPSLSELGGALTVRSMLSSTNIVIFRTSDSLSATMGVPMKVPVDPVNLPAQWPDGTTTAGLGYLPKVGGRVSPFRASKQEDPYHWATSGIPAQWHPDDLAAGVDERGSNYFIDWVELLDVDDDEEEIEAKERAANPTGYVVDVAPGTREKILTFLGERGEPVKLTVIAAAAGVSRSAASNVLKRLNAEGRVESRRRGMWGLTATETAAKAEQDALVNA